MELELRALARQKTQAIGMTTGDFSAWPGVGGVVCVNAKVARLRRGSS